MKIEVFCLAVLLLMPFASANLVLSQPEDLYNRGDSFSTTLTIVKQSDAQGFLTLTLACQGYAVEFYRLPTKVFAGKDAIYQVSSTLDSFLVGNVTGICSIQAEFDGESIISNSFELSNVIDVTLDSQTSTKKPGSTFQISGNAQKKNGQALNGFIEVSVPDFDFKTLASVNQGSFNTTLTLDKDAKSGKHEIIVRAYEKDSSDEILNEGKAQIEFEVEQVLSKVDIALNTGDLIPNEEIVFTGVGYDQANDEMTISVRLRMLDSNGKSLIDKSVSAGQTQSYLLPGNASPGSWKIILNAENYTTEKTFNVQNFEKIGFILENNSLIVRNLGNVRYTKPLEVAIGTTSEIVQVDLDVNEIKEFKLSAPDGEYNIEIRQGAATESLGKTFLTGRAISISDKSAFSSSISWIWLIILIGLGIAVVYYYNKISKKDYISEQPKYSIVNPVKQAMSSIANAPSDMIQHGEKQKAVVVALSLKNFSELKGKDSSARQTLQGIIADAKNDKIHVMQTSEAILFVFSSLLKKENALATPAVIFANNLKKKLEDHNNKFAQRIVFGLGVHTGDIIAELSNGQFKFHALGNIVTFAKKLADKVDSNIYLSNPIHSESRAQVKVSRVDNFWQVVSINERKSANEFIERFKQRNF